MPEIPRRVSAVLSVVAIAVGAVAIVASAVALTGGGGDDEGAPRSNSHDYAVWLVDQAIERYERDGLEATLAHHNSRESVDGEWYVFIANEAGELIGHHNADYRGQLLTGPLGTDVSGYPYGHAMAAADERGRWVSYVFLNPATGEEQRKHSWVIRRDGLLFGAGWYDYAAIAPAAPSPANGPAYAPWLVEQAIARYERDGLEATLEHHNSPDSVDGQWYVFIISEDDKVIGHYNPEVRGSPLTDCCRADATGYEQGRVIAAASEQGLWVRYVSTDPVSGEPTLKHAWVIRHDGLIFGTGWYLHARYTAPAPSKVNAPAYAVWLVDQALMRLDRDGLEATLEHLNSPAALDGSWYVFGLEDRAGALYSIANPNRPDVVGTTYDRIDSSGFNFGEAFAATADGGAGQWVSYLFTHPETREDALKHSWIVRRGNILFGAGWYDGIK